MDQTRPPAFPYPSSPFTIHNSLFPIPPLRIPAMVGYGKLWKVMEGYGNFPASARPCRAEARRRRIPPFQPLAFSLQHLPSPRRSNPVKPSQTMFLGWTATKDRSAPSKNRSFSRRFFPARLFPLWLSTLDSRPSTLLAAPPLCVPLRQISRKPMGVKKLGRCNSIEAEAVEDKERKDRQQDRQHIGLKSRLYFK